MGVDKGYGSGKSRTAANSRSRRRVAAGQLTKSKKSIGSMIKAGNARRAASPLGQLADTVLGFALPVGKVKAAAMGLRAAGKIGQASALEARVLAKRAGQQTARFGGTAINDVSMRNQSTSVFPRIDSTKIRTAPNRILEMQGRKRAAEYTDMDKFNDYMSGYPTSRTPKVSEGTLNIVDTRRMNPAQAKSALEKGVNQTTTFKRRVPKKTNPLPVSWPWDKAPKRGR